MKILILGSLGMLGSAVYQYFLEKKIECVGTSKKEVDITSLKNLMDFTKDKDFTHIINCAAYTNVEKAEKELRLAFEVNVKGPENLGYLAKNLGLKVIHFSTDYVFSGETTGKPYIETDICGPLNTYGKTKFEGEKKLLENAPNSCIIRSSWLFGMNGNNFISNMLNLMQQKNEIRVVNDQIGRPTFCYDLAEIAYQLLPYSGIFHFANQENASWYDLTQQIFQEAKDLGFQLTCKSIVPVASNEFIFNAKRPKYSVLDTGKIESILGRPPRPWKEALRAYLKEYLRSLCQ